MVITNPKMNQVSVTFVYLSYDLIDKDLDFDEEYYIKFMSKFRKVLFEECKALVGTGAYIKADITCAKLIMKGDAAIEHYIHLDCTSSGITSYTKESCF